LAFRADGFRGAGIAAICRGAGVSAGNLYHYFESKEAIVAEIVERDRARIRSEMAKLLAADDPIEAITSAMLVDRRADMSLDPVMTIEIYAEATRNPRVAQIVQDFERHSLTEVVAMLTSLQDTGRIAPAHDLMAVARVLMALVDGVLARSLADPETDISALARPLRAVIGTLLTAAEK